MRFYSFLSTLNTTFPHPYPPHPSSLLPQNKEKISSSLHLFSNPLCFSEKSVYWPPVEEYICKLMQRDGFCWSRLREVGRSSV